MPIIKEDRRERWLAISAISDLKLAKRKYFTAESGVLLYEEAILTGLTNTTRSLEDALFCNARLRTYEISKMMPIISEAINIRIKRTRNSYFFLASVSLLTAILLIVLILLFKMKKKLKGHKGLNVANDQLSA
jgi:hypothetical protein